MGFLHKKNHQTRNKDPFIRLLTPMIAGFVTCVFCLVSLTWAWFTASVDTETQTIEAAVRSTSVKVYEITKTTVENGGVTETRTLKMPVAEGISLLENTGEEPQGVTIEEEPVVWELSPEKSYEVILTGDGTASKGYCKVALSHTVSGSNTPETKLYKTPAFDKEASIGFTYHTGGFANEEGVTETSWNEYVNNVVTPTLTIASFWGNPEGETAQVSLMSVGETEEYMLLSDGDVLGFAPIPCPEAKAETEMDLVGFEMEEGTVISAAEDYQVALTLKEGYEMPAEVTVNIDGKDYVVSTTGTEANEKAPYYDAETGILTVPAALLHDGATVILQAEATPIPEEPAEEEEEETEEEPEEETVEETETEETPVAEEPEESLVTENPAKKEEDEAEEGKLSVKPVKTSSGNGGRDDDKADRETEEDAEDEENADSDSNAGDNASDEEDALAAARNEKIDVSFTLAQLTIDLEKTNLPANADLVLTLAAKEGEEYPEQFVITLDKTIRDEENEDEKIEEDKTEYTINADGENNPEGFAFDAETGELTIESELLVGVRAISIADGESEEDEETEEEAILPFEVKNLTFAFGDTEFALEGDMVILFTAGEGYELPETIIITIDDEEYVIYTSEEDSEENPEGITFDAETGTLTISKDLLEDAEAISIAAEAVKVEEEDSEEDDSEEDGEEEDDEENSDQDSEDEDEEDDNNTTEGDADSGDDDDTGTENGGDSSGDESGDSTENENGDSTGTEENTGSNENAGGDNQDTENGEATEDENETEGGENTGETDTETNPDDTTEGAENGTDGPATTNPEEEEGGNEQGGEGDDESGNATSGTENGSGDETTTPSGDDNSATIPDAPEAGEPASGDNAESGNTESTGKGKDDSGNNTVSSSSGEAATLPSVGDVAQSGSNTSDAPATDSHKGESSSADTTLGSKEASSEE